MTQTKTELLQTRHQGDIRLGDADSTHYVGFKAPATVGSNLVWTLPATDGSANQFLQTNASGVLGWGTADVSSAMPLTGGTFTGDVTFDGATAGRDIVFDRSDNALEFADNAKAVFGAALSIYHNGTDNVFGADAGDTTKFYGPLFEIYSLDGTKKSTSFNPVTGVELYHNNAKKFETSATGVAITGAATISTNLTVTGDLTVSGTTTTINTQTLDVEDKNVVIGKVSSPSDTTADGGGWTLKGATDKTFNWVNSTDAWTSSEHIHLGDNKKLLAGTGSDLSIYHNGTHSLVQNNNGTLHMSSDSLKLTNTNIGHLFLEATLSNSVDIYYNNSKKFETTNTGINVTGAINVNGSALSTAPEIEATATGAISDQAAVAVRSDGTIEAISGNNEATGSITDFDSTTSTYIMPVRVLYDPDINKVVIFYVRMQSGDPYFYSMICGINSNNTLSLGTQKKISTPDSMDRIGGSQANTYATACYNTANNKYMIAYRGQDNRMHTAHGTVQSNHTDITWTSGGNHTNSEMWQPNYIRMEYSPDDNSAQLVWRRTSDNYLYRANFQYSSSQDKLHMQNSPSAVISQSSSNIEISYDTNVNRYMIGYKNDQGSAVGRIVTTDDSGGNSQGPYAFSNGDTGGNMAIFVPSENKSIICYSTSSATGLFAKVVTQASDGSITYGAEVGVDTTGSASHITTALDATNNKVVVSWYNGGTNVRYVSSGTISGTTTTWSSRYTVTNGVGHAAIGWNTNDGKSLIASRDGLNNDAGQAQAYRPASTNLNTENFIGFAKAAINSGAAGAVKVTGNTATKSSLTPGQKYYVQNDGSIGLTPATGTEVEAGIALSTTKLLIKG
jgi:hypothetical protein